MLVLQQSRKYFKTFCRVIICWRTLKNRQLQIRIVTFVIKPSPNINVSSHQPCKLLKGHIIKCSSFFPRHHHKFKRLTHLLFFTFTYLTHWRILQEVQDQIKCENFFFSGEHLLMSILSTSRTWLYYHNWGLFWILLTLNNLLPEIIFQPAFVR